MALDTEEEQVEKIKNIWNSYKQFIIIIIAVLLGVYFTYDYYADKKIKNSEQASQLYQEILVGKILDINSIKTKVDLLKKNSSYTPYASRSAIYIAKLYSQGGSNEKAIKELIWAAENATEESIQSMAYYHLANLFFVTDNLDKAMEAAKKINSFGFQILAKDIIGDIFLKQGSKEEAKKLYLEALKLNNGQSDFSKILQNKIDSIGQ
jgi:predicted negative regulator of RcsB-dependent stress response